MTRRVLPSARMEQPPRTRSLLLACALLAGGPCACLGSLDYLGEGEASASSGGCQASDDDPENCGSCGRSCRGGACEAGVCQPVVVADAQDGAFGVAVDDTHVFWSTQGSRRVLRAPKSGGEAELVAESTPGSVVFTPTFLAVTATHAVWINYESGTLQDGMALIAAPKAGGAAAGFAENSPDANSGLAADGDRFWFANFGVNAVRSAQLGQSYANVSEGQSNPAQVAVDDAFVYWTNQSESADNGGVMRAPRDGSAAAEDLAPEIESATGIALDADAVYVTAGSGIHRVPKVGGGSDWNVGGQFDPVGITVSNGRVFWVNAGGGGSSGTVMTVEAGAPAATVQTLASGQATPRLVAVDDTQVFWTNHGDTPGTGSVMRVAR